MREAASRQRVPRRQPRRIPPRQFHIIYFVMNSIVVPLSAAATGPFSWPVFLNGILIRMFGVGLPASLAARAARSRSDAGLTPV